MVDIHFLLWQILNLDNVSLFLTQVQIDIFKFIFYLFFFVVLGITNIESNITPGKSVYLYPRSPRSVDK